MAKMCPDVASFRSIVEHKEKEIVGLCEEQLLGLQHQLCQKDKELSDLAARFVQLQEDFKYNLALLDERDAELMEYDVSTPVLQASTLQAEERLREAGEALSAAHIELSREKQKLVELERRSENETKMFQSELETIKQDNEGMCKQLKRLEAENADLRRQIGRRHSEFCTKSEELDKRYLDEIRKQEVDFQVAMDEVSKKLRIAESESKQLRQCLDEECQKQIVQKRTESDLKAQLMDKEQEIQRLHADVKQLERELDNVKLEANLEEKHLADKFDKLENEYETQVSQLRGQVACLTRKLEVSQARVKECETEKFEQLSQCSQKLHKLEQGILEKETCLAKLEQAESSFRKTFSVQEEQLKEKELQCNKWKMEHDAAQTQIKALQEAYAREKEKFLQATILRDQYHAKPSKFRAGNQGKGESPVDTWTLDLGLDELSIPEPEAERGFDAENRRLRTTLQEIKDENARLRTAVETMRREMENLQNHHFDEGSTTIKLVEQKSEEGRAVHEELQSLRTMVAKIASSVEREKPEQKTECNSARGTEDSKQPNAFELERTQAILRAQLEGAISDITRITNERDLLMELSNSLRADLNRMLSSSAALNVEDGGREADSVCTPRLDNQISVVAMPQIQLQGNSVPQHIRQQPELISHKGTVSQHARLRMLKRKDEMKPNKQKIRNYNVKDDD